ncbi:hypothetical protein KRP22_002583 [Phytophthora ramorum]|nr:hypothetical protein KRP22_6230 [Phytophthora ramorum]
MRRKARVAGAAVGIPQDTEGDATGLKRGWVLHATERNVVLRDAQNSLRVADALAFCAGSIVVQHGVDLPLNATFSSNNYPAKYAVAWMNSPECDSEHSSAVYVVDFQTGEVSVEHLPNLNEQIGDVFVDSNGKQIAVIETLEQSMRAVVDDLLAQLRWESASCTYAQVFKRVALSL